RPAEWLQSTNWYQPFVPSTPFAPPRSADPVGREIHAGTPAASISKRQVRQTGCITGPQEKTAHHCFCGTSLRIGEIPSPITCSAAGALAGVQTKIPD